MEAAKRIARTIADEIGARPEQVGAAVTLLDEGATVPFIARYRKEATGGLDDSQLRRLADRVVYLRELEARRVSILETIREQGKLTEDLATSIARAETKAELEDIYLPFKPKRRTKAMIARENGLEPLAEAILADRSADPEALAEGFVTEAVPTAKDALNGARDILAEQLSENAALLGELRAFMQKEAFLSAKAVPGQEEKGAKFSDYFDHRELWANVPSHRALAMMRASNEGVVTLDIAPDPETGAARAEAMVAAQLEARGEGPGDAWLRQVAGWTWRVKLSLSMMIDLMGDLRARAQEEAIAVFARNLRDLLLAAPAGARPTLGLDPGIRTGVKAAVVDATGKLVATDTLYPFQPKNDLRGAQEAILRLIRAHGVELIAIGNGTASRETERMVGETLKLLPAGVKAPVKVVVSEAGASVYSASELAAREFPGLDVSLRGAVSIGRRLMDPLAELVKIDPQSIGVGQYQHDVNQRLLKQALDDTVLSCVNSVGVEVNTASRQLLSYVSGITARTAEAICSYREQHGKFRDRNQLKEVAGIGAKVFEQAAGFLRIREAVNPLDASAVHPESYPVVRRMAADIGCSVEELIRDPLCRRKVRIESYVDESTGLPTLRDIMRELEKPGRDPRAEFELFQFSDAVHQPSDLSEGMVLPGIVTNVTAFGAFVDIGVHQDGLVHISQITNKFIHHPSEVVSVGDIVEVMVLAVETEKKRISLSMKQAKQ